VFYLLPVLSLRITSLFPYTTLFRSRRFEAPAARTSGEEGTVGQPHRLPFRQAQRLPYNTTTMHFLQSLAEAFANKPIDWDELERSEEHTSELQSRSEIVCRLLLEKK